MKWRTALITISICLFFAFAVRGEKSTEVTADSRAATADSSLQRFARLAASYELAKAHSRELEKPDDARVIWNPLFDQLLVATDLHASCQAWIIPPPDVAKGQRKRSVGETDGRGIALTEFEIRAVKRIEGGASEVLERVTPQRLLYVRSIDVLKSCTYVCHSDGEFFDPSVDFMRSNKVDGMVISLDIALENRHGVEK